MISDVTTQSLHFRWKATDEKHILIMFAHTAFAMSVDHADRLDAVPVGKQWFVGNFNRIVNSTLFSAVRFLNGDMTTQTIDLIVLLAVLDE